MHTSELFRYVFSRVANRFEDVHIVTVRPIKKKDSRWASFQRKIKKLGIPLLLEVITAYPAQRYFSKIDQAELDRLMRSLPRPEHSFDIKHCIVVSSVNGAEAVLAMKAINPDVIIQAGAGILRRNIFSCAKIGTLNMHHGIAPLIKGMNSIYWALWENKPEWIGSTIHFIDDGIDTGDVLAYAPITIIDSREGFPSLFTRATEEGVTQLLLVLDRLAAGERWRIPVPEGQQVYRSTFSGWRRIWLVIRHVFISFSSNK
jgi:methionyl-tRNA formyltransferase